MRIGRALFALGAAAAGAWLSIGALSGALSASPSGVVTVCQAGPPQCDHQTIQEGIDAAVASDTVLVSPGMYVERVALRGGVALASSDGPDVTRITTPEMPVIRASGVASAVVQGFDIAGQIAVTSAVGIEIVDSELALVGCVIHNVRGADGDAAHWNGWGAVGIRAMGVSTLTIRESTVRDIRAGDSFEWCYTTGSGGEVVGIWVGSGKVVIVDSVIYRVSGGRGNETGVGGAAIGIQTSGADLAIERSEFTAVEGGIGGIASPPCMGYAPSGASAVVQTAGGTVALRESRLMLSDGERGGAPRYGLRTVGTSATYVERSAIVDAGLPYAGFQAGYVGEGGANAVPYCPPVSWQQCDRRGRRDGCCAAGGG